MELRLESGYTSLNKNGEELCGDKVECISDKNHTTLVLADGLGSGVKANILATLTSKILCTMIANGIDIDECVSTIIQTLPVCKERGVAYATFSVVHLDRDGKGYLFEFDNPAAILIHNGVAGDLPREKHEYCNKTVFVTRLTLECDDTIVLMSDGVIHAGIGKLLNFGWLREDVISHLNKVITPDMSARCTACLLAAACNDLYVNEPGDDTTVAAIKVRKATYARVMVGPPVNRETANECVAKFLDGEGLKVVCGGTTSHIVADYLKTKLETEFDFLDSDVPPIARIKGIDLTTEGVLTLRKTLVYSEKYISEKDLTKKFYTQKDGASMLAEILFEKATDVVFFVGQSVNEAHKGLPIDTTMKLKLVESLAKNLRLMGKRVELNYD